MDEGIVKSMGTIVVKVCRIQVLGPSYRQVAYAPPPSSAVLHERSKKAQLSHRTGLGAPVVTPVQTRTEATRLETFENPYKTFEIAYRSRTLLELLDIVPASEIAQPAPAPAAAATLAAGPSNGNAGSNSSAKKRKATAVITIDSDSDEPGKKDVKPKIKAEKKIKGEKGAKKENIVLEVD